jgi:hypothetical protein
MARTEGSVPSLGRIYSRRKCVRWIRRAITPSQNPSVLKDWREPTYEEFRPRTAWSLFDAATADIKGTNRNGREPHTGLHGLFDGLVGLI